MMVPQGWKWPFGTSLSVEFGFFRPNVNASFFWQGEIRPIIDKTMKNWYVSFNPDINFILTGPGKQWVLSPQLKTVYSIKQKFGVGFEYYTGIGTFQKIPSFDAQEHLIGPMFDLYTDPKWELNTGFLFGLTPGSNQRIFKLLIGRRFGK
ncbi:MAG: transporter [Chitinophagaceae bacterium]|nr:transporter [Chitinophagaceae bacterium]